MCISNISPSPLDSNQLLYIYILYVSLYIIVKINWKAAIALKIAWSLHRLLSHFNFSTASPFHSFKLCFFSINYWLAHDIIYCQYRPYISSAVSYAICLQPWCLISTMQYLLSFTWMSDKWQLTICNIQCSINNWGIHNNFEDLIISIFRIYHSESFKSISQCHT